MTIIMMNNDDDDNDNNRDGKRWQEIHKLWAYHTLYADININLNPYLKDNPDTTANHFKQLVYT